MDVFTLSFWGISIALMGVSLKKSKSRTLEAMKKSKGMMGSMLGEIVGIIFIIGLVLTFIPPESIKAVLGSENKVFATLAAAVAGSVTLIPAFVAFCRGWCEYRTGSCIFNNANHGWSGHLSTRAKGVRLLPIWYWRFGCRIKLQQPLAIAFIT